MKKKKIFPNTINFFGQNKVTDEKSVLKVSAYGVCTFIYV